ncbi:uncharacterized protein LOC122254956 [Penaeus japonicus]|uniref:uncharacterized protein LOC122254956 n=1 Tax=Penaeus japonicus TaxID=27405 RepID=UPI001C70C940|nr:uncharacterized protein LOC122254956 [Penaeus japonicus]
MTSQSLLRNAGIQSTETWWFLCEMECAVKVFLFFVVFSVVSPFQLKKDCLVENEISEEVVFNSLEFLSFIHKGFMNEILLNCQDSYTGHLLSLSHDRITWKKLSQHDDVLSQTFHPPEKPDGWTRFRLGLGNNITLDSDGESWLPEDLALDCTVQSVSIRNGTFTRECTSNTPTWVVEVKGAELEIGLRGGALVTSAQGALPPFPLNIAFTILSEEGRAQLKVTTLGREVFEAPLKDVPTCLEVSSSDGKLVVVQNLHVGAPETTDSVCHACETNEATVWYLTGGLSMVVVVLLGFLVFQNMHRFCKRGSQVREVAPERNPSHPVPPIEPAYLEPKPAPAQGLQPASRTSSIADHVYEEVDEATWGTARKNAVPHVSTDVLYESDMSSSEYDVASNK